MRAQTRAVALLTLLVTSSAFAEAPPSAGAEAPPAAAMPSDKPATIQIEGGAVVLPDGTQLSIPDGVFFNKPGYIKLTDAVEGMQRANVGLQAENDALKGKVDAIDARSKLNVWVVVGAVILGAAAGVGVYVYAAHH